MTLDSHAMLQMSTVRSTQAGATSSIMARSLRREPRRTKNTKNFGDRRHNLEIRQNGLPAAWDDFEVMAPVPEFPRIPGWPEGLN